MSGGKLLLAVESLIFARRGVLMALLLAITAVMGVAASQSRVAASFEARLPLGHAYLRALERHRADFGGANSLQVALIRNSGTIYDAAFLARLKAATDDLKTLPGVDAARVSSLFTPDVRFIEVVDGGFRGGSVIPDDYQPTQAVFDRIRANVLRGGHIGHYTSNDQRGAMIFADVREVDPATGQRLDYGALAAQLDALREKYSADDTQVYIAGFAPLVGEVGAHAGPSLHRFGVGLAAALLLLIVATRSLLPALLAWLGAVVALVWQFGALRILGLGVDAFTLLAPTLVLAAAVFQGLRQVDAWTREIGEGRDAQQAARLAWRRLALPAGASLLVALLGAASLLPAPFGAVRETALSVCLGVVGVAVASLVMLPLGLSVLPIRNPAAFAARRGAPAGGLWTLLSNSLRPGVVTALVMLGAAAFGWALWQQQALHVGDTRSAVPDLLPEARLNQDARVLQDRYAVGVDTLKVIAETDAEACTRYEAMDQIDRMAWHLQNLPGVQGTASLPQLARSANAAFSEQNPKYRMLPRAESLMVQAVSPVPASTGLLNANCSAMAIFAYLHQPDAATITRVTDEVQDFNRRNASAFYENNKGVSAKYCDAKVEARRQLDEARLAQAGVVRRLRAANPAMSADEIDRSAAAVQGKAQVVAAQERLAGMGKVCPVNFVLATGNAGARAAVDQALAGQDQFVLLGVWIAAAVCIYLCFLELAAVLAIGLPLLLVSSALYAAMPLLGLGVTVGNLPIVALAMALGAGYGVHVYAAFAEGLEHGATAQDAGRLMWQGAGKAVLVAGLALGVGAAAWVTAGLQFQRDAGVLLALLAAGHVVGAVLLVPAVASMVLRDRAAG